MGRATAIALAGEGASVVLWGRRRELLESCAEEVDAAGGNALVQSLDVADEQAVEEAVRAVVERFGRVDVLVNNAGTNTPRRLFRDSALEDWQRVVDTNLTGVFLCIRAVLPTMRRQRSGLIVNVASGAALQASLKSGVAYSAAKRGVVALTQMVNAEEWENGIRASTVYPGDVDTPILDLRPTPPPPELRATMLRPEDIAAAVVFLAALPARALVEDLVIKPVNRKL